MLVLSVMDSSGKDPVVLKLGLTFTKVSTIQDSLYSNINSHYFGGFLYFRVLSHRSLSMRKDRNYKFLYFLFSVYPCILL